MNKFYNSLIKHDKFYNKFYTSSTSSTQNPLKMKRQIDGICLFLVLMVVSEAERG